MTFFTAQEFVLSCGYYSGDVLWHTSFSTSVVHGYNLRKGTICYRLLYLLKGCEYCIFNALFRSYRVLDIHHWLLASYMAKIKV